MSSQAERGKVDTEHGVVQERDARTISLSDMGDLKENFPRSVGDAEQACSLALTGGKTSQIDVSEDISRTNDIILTADFQGRHSDDLNADVEGTRHSSLPPAGGQHTGVVTEAGVADSTEGCAALNTPETHSEERSCKLRRTSGEMKLKSALKPSNRAAYQEVALAEADFPEIVGRRIKVYWPLDKIWYRGQVKAYQPSRKMHKIVYDDSDEEWLKLGEEKCKLEVYPGDMFGFGAMWPEEEHEEVAGSDGIARLEVVQEICSTQLQPLETSSSRVEVGACIESPPIEKLESPGCVEEVEAELGGELGVARVEDGWEHAVKAEIGQHALCDRLLEGREFVQRPLGMRVEVSCDVSPPEEHGLTAPAWEPLAATVPCKIPEVALSGRGLTKRILQPTKDVGFRQYHIHGGVNIFCVSTGHVGVEKLCPAQPISADGRMEMSALLGNGRSPQHVDGLNGRVGGGGEGEIAAGEVQALPGSAGPSASNGYPDGCGQARDLPAGCVAEDRALEDQVPRVVDQVERECDGIAVGIKKGRRTHKGPKRMGELSACDSPEVIELDKDDSTAAHCGMQAGDRETGSLGARDSPSWMPDDGVGPGGAFGPHKVNVLKLRRCPTNGGQWTVASGSGVGLDSGGMTRAGMESEGQIVEAGCAGAENGISVQWRSRQPAALSSGGSGEPHGFMAMNFSGDEPCGPGNADASSAGEEDLRFGYGSGKGHARSQKRGGGRPGPIDVDVAVAVEPKGEVVAGSVDVKEARRRKKKALTPDTDGDMLERSTSGRYKSGRVETGRREQREGSGSPWEQDSCLAKLVVVQDDQGKREIRAIVDVRDIGDKTWVLAVSFNGEILYRYKPDQQHAVGGLNRYNHTMVWKGPEKERWSLEFDDRREWSRFKELYEECVQRNIRAAAVRHIPIPGVVEVADYYKRNHWPKFVRPAKSYIKRSEGEAELALANTRVVYDMDSEDEQWLLSKHAEGKAMITEDVLERIMDRLEKDSFTLQEPVSLEVAEELLEDLAPRDVVAAIHDHWYKRRMKKKMALVRHFQPPSWMLYHFQVQEMEQQQKLRQLQEAEGGSLPILQDTAWCENPLTVSMVQKPLNMQYATLQPGSSRRPPLFAFCLRPRGMEGPNKLHKQKSQQKRLEKVLSSPRVPSEAWGTPVASTPSTPVTLGAEARNALAAGMIAERQNSRKRKAELKPTEGLKKVLPRPHREVLVNSITRNAADTPKSEKRTFESPRQRARLLATSQEAPAPSPPASEVSDPLPSPPELPKRIVKASQRGCDGAVSLQLRPSPLSLPTPILTPVASPLLEEVAKTPRAKGSWKVKGKKSKRLRLAMAGAAGAAARKRKMTESSSSQPVEGEEVRPRETKAPRHASYPAVLMEQVLKPTRHSPRGEPGAVVVDLEAVAAEKAAAAKTARKTAIDRRIRAQGLYALADAALCRAVSAVVAAEAAQAADAAMEAAMAANPGVLTGTGLTPRSYSRGWGGIFANVGSRLSQVAVAEQVSAEVRATGGKRRGKGKKGWRSLMQNSAGGLRRKSKSLKKALTEESPLDTEAPPLVATDGSQLLNGGRSEVEEVHPVSSWSGELGASQGTQGEQPKRMARVSSLPRSSKACSSEVAAANGQGNGKHSTGYPLFTGVRTRGETRHAGS